ncbi:MAG: RlmE family RNA methyltransferase [Candidatus Hadarchaeota archaeon]
MSRTEERKAEFYYRSAKREGLRSRAAYKLAELDRSYHIFKRGDVVVDLGAAPGGWLQVAGERVGESGFVLGVDIQPIKKLPQKNISVILGDITLDSTLELVKKNLPRKADVILSDVSPGITGVWDVDHFRSIELARTTLKAAGVLLAPGGKFLVKVFQGELFSEFLNEVKKRFEFVKVSKPSASRKGSSETYVVGVGFMPGA